MSLHKTGQTQVGKQTRGQEEGARLTFSAGPTSIRLTLQQRELLSTTFQCLFCNHENSVSVKIDKKASTGELTCKVCGQTFQTVTNCTSTWEEREETLREGL
jgi:transposase-like protein